MKKARLEEYLAFRCNPADRVKLKRLSELLSITESATARAVLRAGLKVVGDHGIQPQREAPAERGG
jgi:hypothetical protein